MVSPPECAQRSSPPGLPEGHAFLTKGIPSPISTGGLTEERARRPRSQGHTASGPLAGDPVSALPADDLGDDEVDVAQGSLLTLRLFDFFPRGVLDRTTLEGAVVREAYCLVTEKTTGLKASPALTSTGELWPRRFFDGALRTVKEYAETVEYVHLIRFAEF